MKICKKERNNSTNPVSSISCCNNQLIDIYCLSVEIPSKNYRTTKNEANQNSKQINTAKTYKAATLVENGK